MWRERIDMKTIAGLAVQTGLAIAMTLTVIAPSAPARAQATLNSQAADIGQSKVELPISYDGEELTITFDPRYVAEFLRVLESEKSLTLSLIDGESAAVFRTDDAYTYVVMPLSRDR